MIKKLVPVLLFVMAFFSIILTQIGCSKTVEGASPEQIVDRGKYLVTLGGCNHCHSPKVMTPNGPELDPERILSGYHENFPLTGLDTAMKQTNKWIMTNGELTAWVGPWGVSFTANLTPDNATGIGTWTEDVFIKAMRNGKHMGIGRMILPPMPWQDIGKSTDDDLKAIFTYLKSLPAIRNAVPDPISPDKLLAKK